MTVHCFAFGPFLLVPRRQVLLKDGSPVRIGNRAFDILTMLVQRPGELMNKQELITHVWDGTFVDESNLKVNIAAIRKAIDDHCAPRSCIATVIGRGYRFVEPVRKVNMEDSCCLSMRQDSFRRNRWRWLRMRSRNSFDRHAGSGTRRIHRKRLVSRPRRSLA